MAALDHDPSFQPQSLTQGNLPSTSPTRNRSFTFSEQYFRRRKPHHAPTSSLPNVEQLRPKQYNEWNTPSSSDLDAFSIAISQQSHSSRVASSQNTQSLEQDISPDGLARLRNDSSLGLPNELRPRSHSVTTYIAPTRNNSQDEVTRPAPIFVAEQPASPFDRGALGGEVSPSRSKPGPWKRMPSFRMAPFSSKLKVSRLPFRRRATASDLSKSSTCSSPLDSVAPTRPRPTLSILYDPATGRISGIENPKDLFQGLDPVALLPPEKTDSTSISPSDRWNPVKIKELCVRFLKQLPINAFSQIPDTFNLVVSSVLPNRPSENRPSENRPSENRPSENQEPNRPSSVEPADSPSGTRSLDRPLPEGPTLVEGRTQGTRHRSVIFSQYIHLSPSVDDFLHIPSPTQETPVSEIPPLSPPDQWTQDVLFALSGPSNSSAGSDVNRLEPGSLQLHCIGYL
ncbi:hypothetical protein CPB86DRAFT_228997 [Serendipita vermifera]|nr:hypothetical protein CPB86DRAFT_228997 [Serendipita vermifera]